MDITVYGDTVYVKNGKFTAKSLPVLTGDSATLRLLFNTVFDFRIVTSSYIEVDMQPQLENASA